MDKKSLLICLVLFAVSLIVGYGTYEFVNILVDKDEVVDSDKSDILADDNQLIEKDNDDIILDKPATEVYEKVVHYSGSHLNIVDYIVEFDNDNGYKDKLLTLTVDGIKLENKEYKFSFKNHPQNCTDFLDYMDNDGYNEFYINDTVIYHQGDQSCYLEKVHYITVIDNKYIGIAFYGQGGNYMKIYDKDIKLIDTLEYSDIVIDDNGIVFSEYVDDSGCLLNYYSYNIVNEKIIKTFEKKLNNTECNMVTGEGCNCSNDDSNVIKLKLTKENENIDLGNVYLNFIGVRTDEFAGEMGYEYALDIMVNNKKINSNIFSNKDNMVIWSSNMASSFEFLEIDNLYIFTSFIAKQNDGSYVLVIDKNGNFVKSFEDVDITIDEVKLEIEITDCKSYEVGADCSINKYKLNELK